jgi:Uma2 family endonuclease
VAHLIAKAEALAYLEAKANAVACAGRPRCKIVPAEAQFMMTLDLSSLAAPVLIRPAVPLTDEELIHFSEVNKPYRFERNKYGEIVMMTPVGGIGGTHEGWVFSSLINWNETAQTGIAFGPNTGFNLPDGSCLSPDAAWVSLARWNALTPEEQAGFPPLCPEFLIEVRSRSDSRRMVDEKMQLWLILSMRM